MMRFQPGLRQLECELCYGHAKHVLCGATLNRPINSWDVNESSNQESEAEPI